MRTFLNRVSLGMALAVLIVTFSACGAGTEPRDVSLDVEVGDRQVVGGATTHAITNGDTVTLTVTSDEPGAVHLHGYDLEAETDEHGRAVINFVADADGRFPIEMHLGHSHGDEEVTITLGALEVRPR